MPPVSSKVPSKCHNGARSMLATLHGDCLQGGGGQYSMLSRLQNRQNAGDRTMQTAMREINTVIDRMRLNDAVRNSAYEVFKDVSIAGNITSTALLTWGQLVGVYVTFWVRCCMQLWLSSEGLLVSARLQPTNQRQCAAFSAWPTQQCPCMLARGCHRYQTPRLPRAAP